MSIDSTKEEEAFGCEYRLSERRRRGCEYRIDSLKEEEVEEVHSTSQFYLFFMP